jgi:hypothetical protein
MARLEKPVVPTSPSAGTFPHDGNAAMRAYRLHLGEEALVYRLAYNGDVVAFKMGRRQGKRVGGSAYWRIGVSGDAFSQRVAR